MTTEDIEIGIPRRLGYLPLVMDVLRRTGLLSLLDRVIPEDRRSKVSTSECVSVLLCGVMVGHHDLWRMSDRLMPYDMATVMQDPGFELSAFTEERLARMLDQIYEANLDRLMTEVAVSTILQFRLGTDFLHFDTTSLLMYGAYEREDFASFAGMDEAVPPPSITYGYSKDRRGDLKQIMFGTLATRDGGVPLYGKALDGNCTDSQASAEFFRKVRSLVKDPREVCCVADCKGWSAPVLDVIQREKMRLLSRLPRNHRIHDEVMANREGHVRIIERPARTANDEPDRYEILGMDIDEVLSIVDIDPTNGARSRRQLCVPARAVRVFSSRLWRKKIKALPARRIKEHKQAAAMIARWSQEGHNCSEDAQRVAQRHISENPFATCDIHMEVIQSTGPMKRGRGRPRKIPEPDLPTTHYRIVYRIEEVTSEVCEARLIPDATFILIRTRNMDWEIDDADLIERYKGQYHNEHGFAWLKSGAANKGLNPIFLETPHRVAAICFLYVIGLMVWTLIQRTVRGYLEKHGTGLPYHRNKPSARITTRFFFELFPQLQTVPIRHHGGEWQKRLVGLDDVRALACRALGTPLTALNPVVENRG